MMKPDQIVVSVEHASFRVPARLADLGLNPAFLQSHHGWDPGAKDVGRAIAKSCNAPLHLGRWTRLVADLNRSARHRRVVPPNSGHRRIPGNQELTKEERADRLARYWSPYREAVEADLDAREQEFGKVLHISVHSFTPKLRDEVRNNDIGLLYQPSHPGERAMADRWDEALTARGFKVRRNYPYSGLDDGFCMRMRAERSQRRYLGMEIEMNQSCLRQPAGVAAMARAFVEVVTAEVRS